MGTRTTKPLIANGVVVGEYLSSDDWEEDSQAAVAALSALGLYGKPNPLHVMFGQADAFSRVANRIFVQDFARPPYPSASPFIVNAAFSVELFLKTMHAATGNAVRGHPLLELYDALPEGCKDELAAHSARVAHLRKLKPDTPFRTLLVPLNTAFERWRYVYELQNSGTINTHEVIHVMHTCHDACAAAVQATTR